MQAAAAMVARSCRQLQQPVLRGLAFAAARAATRAVERFARREALAYVTGEITLADILLYATATFEDDVDVLPGAGAGAKKVEVEPEAKHPDDIQFTL